jgi:hypothetical protein
MWRQGSDGHRSWKVTNFKRTFSIYDEEIVASNGLIHEEMLRVIQEVISL